MFITVSFINPCYILITKRMLVSETKESPSLFDTQIWWASRAEDNFVLLEIANFFYKNYHWANVSEYKIANMAHMAHNNKVSNDNLEPSAPITVRF